MGSIDPRHPPLHPAWRRVTVFVAAALSVCALAASASSTAAQQRTVVRVPVTGTIELGLAPFIGRAIGEAEEQGAAAVVLDIDTPGGRIDAAWQIIDDVRDAELPVYAFVNRRALSAGAMIALSADALYMRPGSTIGAATPVDGKGTKASEKMVSAMRSEFRALAEERGFDPRIAAAMVDERIEVPGVVSAGELLTLTTGEAVELGVAGPAPDVELRRQLPDRRDFGIAGSSMSQEREKGRRELRAKRREAAELERRAAAARRDAEARREDAYEAIAGMPLARSAPMGESGVGSAAAGRSRGAVGLGRLDRLPPLQRAIVLREVLGPPKALNRESDLP